MRAWIRLAVALYPPEWRTRYGSEFGALLEDVGPGWRDVWDVLRGALSMQMRMWSFGKVTTACGLAGAMIAAVVAFQTDNRYVSYAVLRLNAPDGAKADAGTLARQLQQVQEKLLSRSSLTDMIQSPELDLYPRERQRMPLEDIVQSMKTQDIQIMAIRSPDGRLSNAFQLAFRYRDPARAQAVTRDLSARMTKLILANGVGPERDLNLEVLDPASLPQKPESPNRLSIAALGLIGGLALGATLMGIRRWRLS